MCQQKYNNRMSGPFGTYAWAETYAQMHTTMYRLKSNGPAPKSASDSELMAMYKNAIYQHDFLIHDNHRTHLMGDRLRNELLNPEITENRRALVIETLNSIDTLTSQPQVRIVNQRNILETIEEELSRRPWLSAPKTDSDFESDAIETDTWTKVNKKH
jgi:hypothetical protein